MKLIHILGGVALLLTCRPISAKHSDQDAIQFQQFPSKNDLNTYKSRQEDYSLDLVQQNTGASIGAFTVQPNTVSDSFKQVNHAIATHQDTSQVHNTLWGLSQDHIQVDRERKFVAAPTPYPAGAPAPDNLPKPFSTTLPTPAQLSTQTPDHQMPAASHLSGPSRSLQQALVTSSQFTPPSTFPGAVQVTPVSAVIRPPGPGLSRFRRSPTRLSRLRAARLRSSRRRSGGRVSSSTNLSMVVAPLSLAAPVSQMTFNAVSATSNPSIGSLSSQAAVVDMGNEQNAEAPGEEDDDDGFRHASTSSRSRAFQHQCCTCRCRGCKKAFSICMSRHQNMQRCNAMLKACQKRRCHSRFGCCSGQNKKTIFKSGNGQCL